MNLIIILLGAGALSIAFHFIGVYAEAKKTVWAMLVFMWIGAIGVATNEISPKGYAFIETIAGKYEKVDSLIEDSKPTITTYEMLSIKKLFSQEKQLAKKQERSF